MAANVAGSPPTTPRLKVARLEPTRSPPPAPRRAARPPLMVAFDLWDEARSAACVAEVLAADADAALYPFFDHDWDPPLCYAIRQKCGVEVIKLLIEHGADVNACDIKGATPMKLLSALPRDATTSRIEEILLSAGATDVAMTMGALSAFPKNSVFGGNRFGISANLDWDPTAISQSAFTFFESDAALNLLGSLPAASARENYAGNSIACSPFAIGQSRKFAHLGA